LPIARLEVKVAEYQQQQNKLSTLGEKKYPLTAAFLGILISASSYVFVAFVQKGYQTVQWFDPVNNIRAAESGLSKFNVLNDAVWPSLCFLLGLALFIYGAIYSARIRRQANAGEESKGSLIFAVTCSGLGILFITALIWYLGWLEPHWDSVSTRILPDVSEATFYRDPGWMRLLLGWKVISFLLGAAVTGLGIVQLTKARGR
jgi:hypothetical protein